MRTVAALTMIMAIVVAAIPVENYGTMRAADGRALDGTQAEAELGYISKRNHSNQRRLSMKMTEKKVKTRIGGGYR